MDRPVSKTGVAFTAYLLLGLFISQPTRADDEILDVWPDKAPGEQATVDDERLITPRPGQSDVSRLTNVSKPTITVFQPDSNVHNGAAVLVCPGGGYNILAIEHEGTDVAKWLNSIGVTAFLLKYRVPRRNDQPKHLAPLQDAQRAMSLVRGQAGKWKVDPDRIGILGFSAGGHLAAATSTNFNQRCYDSMDDVDKVNCRPDFSVLVYPAYLTAEDELAPEIRISDRSPPMFFVHANDDRISPENSVRAYLALRAVKVPTELHIYSTGGHGFGMHKSNDPCSTWPDRCHEWMSRSGFLEAQ